MDLLDSFTTRTDRESRFCEAGMNTVPDAVKLSGDVVAFRRMTSPNIELVHLSHSAGMA